MRSARARTLRSDRERERGAAPRGGAAMVEVGGVEPPSPNDRPGLLRAQPTEDLVVGLPSAEDPTTSPGEVSGGGPRTEPPP